MLSCCQTDDIIKDNKSGLMLFAFTTIIKDLRNKCKLGFHLWSNVLVAMENTFITGYYGQSVQLLIRTHILRINEE